MKWDLKILLILIAVIPLCCLVLVPLQNAYFEEYVAQLKAKYGDAYPYLDPHPTWFTCGYGRVIVFLGVVWMFLLVALFAEIKIKPRLSAALIIPLALMGFMHQGLIPSVESYGVCNCESLIEIAGHPTSDYVVDILFAGDAEFMNGKAPALFSFSSSLLIPIPVLPLPQIVQEKLFPILQNRFRSQVGIELCFY